MRITEAVFGVWGRAVLQWDPFTETFASDAGGPLAFDCVRFLGLIIDRPPAANEAKEIVDCSDVATIVSTFASVLGCPIQQVAC